MRGRAKAVRYDALDRQYPQSLRALLGLSGALLSIIGFVLADGGLLSALGGSSFYVVSGAGLVVTGALIAKHNRAGAWTYTVLMAATFGLGLSFAAGGPTDGPLASLHFLSVGTKGATQ